MKQPIRQIDIGNLLAMFQTVLHQALNQPDFDKSRDILEKAQGSIQRLQQLWKTKISTSKQI